MKIFAVLGLALNFVVLAGCALTPTDDHYLGPKCESAPVIYTNSSLPTTERQYMLPDGSKCTSGM